jgi:hypothetical protein
MTQKVKDQVQDPGSRTGPSFGSWVGDQLRSLWVGLLFFSACASTAYIGFIGTDYLIGHFGIMMMVYTFFGLVGLVCLTMLGSYVRSHQ